MPCSGILGYEKTQSGDALCGFLSPPHFFVPVKHFVFSLSGTKKRQLPRTLDEIRARFKINMYLEIEKYYKLSIDKIMRILYNH